MVDSARNAGTMRHFRRERGGRCVGCNVGISSCELSGDGRAPSRRLVAAIIFPKCPSSCSANSALRVRMDVE